MNAFAHVQVSLVDHSEESIEFFQAFIAREEQVLECASITGDFDFVLKVAATAPEALERFIMHKVLRLGVEWTTTTTFILRQMKVLDALPIDV
ncbi:MAG: Lrp/AsnC ligand binding domain-containing protein [Paracoccaceae bacterium]|nr:Lrp/AsnC ligand binding domain-containing protein [Paracoccaceae bacterium]